MNQHGSVPSQSDLKQSQQQQQQQQQQQPSSALTTGPLNGSYQNGNNNPAVSGAVLPKMDPSNIVSSVNAANGAASASSSTLWDLSMTSWQHMTRTLAHYERLEQIGEGTYGQVYRARCRDSGRMVAMKKMRIHHGGYWGMPLQLIREIKILKRLHHPRLLSMIEVVTSKGVEYMDTDDPPLKPLGGPGGEMDKASDAREAYKGNLFLVLEYVEHDLTGLLDVAYQFEEVQIKCIFKQLLEALSFMHENKYVHRDIKSSNILLDSQFRLKLADFGLARCIEPSILEQMQQSGSTDRSASSSSMDLTNKVITLWYRPPEILLGACQYGPAVDVWSAGCILAELLLGKPLFPGKTELETLNLILDLMGTPPTESWDFFASMKKAKPSSSTSGVPLDLESIRAETPVAPSRLRDKYSSKISLPALNLLEKLLEWNPRKRLTAANALQHSYFWKAPAAPDDPAMLGTLQVGPDGHFHEFQTKKKRKEAKAAAEKARDAARALGANDTDATDEYDKVYLGIMKRVAQEGITASVPKQQQQSTAATVAKEEPPQHTVMDHPDMMLQEEDKAPNDRSRRSRSHSEGRSSSLRRDASGSRHDKRRRDDSSRRRDRSREGGEERRSGRDGEDRRSSRDRDERRSSRDRREREGGERREDRSSRDPDRRRRNREHEERKKDELYPDDRKRRLAEEERRSKDDLDRKERDERRDKEKRRDDKSYDDDSKIKREPDDRGRHRDGKDDEAHRRRRRAEEDSRRRRSKESRLDGPDLPRETIVDAGALANVKHEDKSEKPRDKEESAPIPDRGPDHGGDSKGSPRSVNGEEQPTRPLEVEKRQSNGSAEESGQTATLKTEEGQTSSIKTEEGQTASVSADGGRPAVIPSEEKDRGEPIPLGVTDAVKEENCSVHAVNNEEEKTSRSRLDKSDRDDERRLREESRRDRIKGDDRSRRGEYDDREHRRKPRGDRRGERDRRGDRRDREHEYRSRAHRDDSRRRSRSPMEKDERDRMERPLSHGRDGPRRLPSREADRFAGPPRRGKEDDYLLPRGRDDDFPPPRGRDGDFPPLKGRDGEFPSTKGRGNDYPPGRRGDDYPPPRGKDDDFPPISPPRREDFSHPRGKDDDYPPPRGRGDDFPTLRGKDDDMPPPRGRGEDFPPSRGRGEDFPPPRGKDEEFPPPRGRGEDFPYSRGRGEDFPPPRGRGEDFPLPRAKDEDVLIPRIRGEDFPPPRGRGEDFPPARVRGDKYPPPKGKCEDFPSRGRGEDYQPPRGKDEDFPPSRGRGEDYAPAPRGKDEDFPPRGRDEDLRPPRGRGDDYPSARGKGDDCPPPRGRNDDFTRGPAPGRGDNFRGHPEDVSGRVGPPRDGPPRGRGDGDSRGEDRDRRERSLRDDGFPPGGGPPPNRGGSDHPRGGQPNRLSDDFRGGRSIDFPDRPNGPVREGNDRPLRDDDPQVRAFRDEDPLTSRHRDENTRKRSGPGNRDGPGRYGPADSRRDRSVSPPRRGGDERDMHNRPRDDFRRGRDGDGRDKRGGGPDAPYGPPSRGGRRDQGRR